MTFRRVWVKSLTNLTIDILCIYTIHTGSIIHLERDTHLYVLFLHISLHPLHSARVVDDMVTRGPTAVSGRAFNTYIILPIHTNSMLKVLADSLVNFNYARLYSGSARCCIIPIIPSKVLPRRPDSTLQCVVATFVPIILSLPTALHRQQQQSLSDVENTTKRGIESSTMDVGETKMHHGNSRRCCHPLQI